MADREKGIVLDGDRTPHFHDLPAVPTEEVPLTEGARAAGLTRARTRELANAVAACSGCGQLFVSRAWDDGIGWVPLRWWHRKAKRKLAERMGS